MDAGHAAGGGGGLQLELGSPPMPPLGVIPDRVTGPHPGKFGYRHNIGKPSWST